MRSGNAVLGVFPLTGAGAVGFLGHVSAITGNAEASGDIVARLGHADPTLTDAIKRWGADMERRGCVPRSVKKLCGHASELCARFNWRTVGELTLDGAVTWLGENRASRRWSGPTHDQVVSALKCWGAFMADHGLTAVNVFARLETSGEVCGEGSRAMKTEEASRIIAAAHKWETTDRRVKSPLALWYTFLCLTGLRVAEAASVRWMDLDLDTSPSITTDPAWSKNARRMVVPINAELCGLLREWRRASPANPESPVFPVTPNRHTFGTVISLARVPYHDNRRRIISQHSARKWLATELDRLGASAGIQALGLRHFEGVTQKHYTDRLLDEAREFFDRLPKLWPVETCETITPSGPCENDGLNGCNPGEESIGSTDSQARSSESSTRVRTQLPIPVGNRVLEGVLETHLQFLKIVALTLRSGDGSGTPET